MFELGLVIYRSRRTVQRLHPANPPVCEINSREWHAVAVYEPNPLLVPNKEHYGISSGQGVGTCLQLPGREDAAPARGGSLVTSTLAEISVRGRRDRFAGDGPARQILRSSAPAYCPGLVPRAARFRIWEGLVS